jgi:hypothetical protein
MGFPPWRFIPLNAVTMCSAERHYSGAHLPRPRGSVNRYSDIIDGCPVDHRGKHLRLPLERQRAGPSNASRRHQIRSSKQSASFRL